MQKKRVGSKQVMQALASRRVTAGRTGRALGLDSASQNGSVIDVDVKNKPLGAINKKNLWKCVMQLGSTNEESSYGSEIDLLRRGNYRPLQNVTEGTGIISPDVMNYFLDVHYFEANPSRLSSILFTGEDAETIAGMEIAIVRRTPFGETIDEKIALSSYYKAESQQLNIVTVPIDCEMDASTFVRVYFTPGANVKRVTATFSFARVAERRAAILEG